MSSILTGSTSRLDRFAREFNPAVLEIIVAPMKPSQSSMLPPSSPLPHPPQPASRAWQRMLSGRRLDLLDPSPADIEVLDIAHGLARVARWNGQTTGAHAFSVAQHSVLVEAVMHRDSDRDFDGRCGLAALLHDAPEYVIGDLISPFKAALGLDYKAFENRLQSAIHVRFGLPAALPAQMVTAIKSADRIAAFWEATELAGFSTDEARQYFGDGHDGRSIRPTRELLEPWPTAQAQARFLARFAELADSDNKG